MTKEKLSIQQEFDLLCDEHGEVKEENRLSPIVEIDEEIIDEPGCIMVGPDGDLMEELLEMCESVEKESIAKPET